MALIFSNYVRGAHRIPEPIVAGVVSKRRYVFTLSAAQNVTGNIIDLGVLPANASVVDMILDADDLDTNGAPAIALDVGLMSGDVGADLDAAGNARTIGAEFFSGATTAQAGGVARPTLKTAFRVDPVAYNRSIGLKIATQAATPAQGDIGLTVLFAT